MKRLLVTGVSGFLGWNVCVSARRGWDVTGIFHNHPVTINGVRTLKIDITDYKSVEALIDQIKPDALIHTAAVTDPNYCQLHPSETRRVNLDATVNIAGLCADRGITLAFTSTDLVFDGENPPYSEDDPVCPVNIYGEQKAHAEEEILKRHPDAIVCRMPLMFGSPSPAHESFIQPMIRAMREGRELRLFIDEFRTPVSADTAVRGIFLALERVRGIIHLGGAQRISRYEFGLMLRDIMGMPDAKIKGLYQKDMPMPAPRARDVSLDSSRAFALGYNPLPLKEEIRHYALHM